MNELLTFDDVLIKPKFSTVTSRKNVDLSFNKSGFPYMELPIISANMAAITESKMALAMLECNGNACLHRFQSIEANVQMFLDSKYDEHRLPMVSIGLGNRELERAKALFYNGATCFVVDVANGASISVVKQAKELKNIIGNNGSIVVGNFATGESVKTFLEYTGTIIDGIKVGIGPGSICKTRTVTGCGYPQLSAILEISQTLKKTGIVVVADGGMNSVGDIAKAIGAGASLVMSGRFFSGTDESPGELIYMSGSVEIGEGQTIDPSCYPPSRKPKPFKKYSGSASQESYDAQDKNASWRTTEGETILVPYKGPVKKVLQDIEGGLRSAFSYVGAHNTRDFHKNVEFVRVSSNTVIENGIRNGSK